MTQSKQVVRELAADIRRQQTRLPASKQAPLNVPFVNSALLLFVKCAIRKVYGNHV